MVLLDGGEFSEAIAARSLRMTWRYSSGICSTVSTLRMPRRTPLAAGRDGQPGVARARLPGSGGHAAPPRPTSAGPPTARTSSPASRGRAPTAISCSIRNVFRPHPGHLRADGQHVAVAGGAQELRAGFDDGTPTMSYFGNASGHGSPATRRALTAEVVPLEEARIETNAAGSTSLHRI